MIFSSSIIEEWLLSGKAVYKNLACGNAGLVQIPVPEGKTYIITKITILPFANIITDTENFANNNTLFTTELQDLENINKRSQYQLLFWNERINNSWNVRNSFGLNTAHNFAASTVTLPAAYYEKQEIDTFMIVESNSWIYLKYIDFINSPSTVYQDSYNNIFNGNQNWQSNPPFNYSDQEDLFNVASPAGPSFDYTPQGLNTAVSTPDFNSDQFVLPAFDVLIDPTQESSFIPPLPLNSAASAPINSDWLNSIPLYNIEYIEVNRRLSTNGLL